MSDVARLQPRAANRAVSQQNLDDAEAATKVAEAEVLAADAALTRAKLDLGYTEMRAPFDGMVGPREVDVENYVGGSSSTTLLATVSTTDPMLAVPVSLLGTFAIFGPHGFTVNTLTLFALVLAITIVVVEAVEHHIEHGLSPLDATKREMTEVSGPVVAIALVLCSVFVPVSFMGGIKGKMYQQFAITLVLLAGIYAGTFGLLKKLPTSFLPDEDLGYLFVIVTLPDGASQERTDRVLQKVETTLEMAPGVEDVITIGSLNLLSGGRSSNAGVCIVSLKDWTEREAPEAQVQQIVPGIFAAVSQIPEAMIITDRFLAAAHQRPELSRVFSFYSDRVPQLFVELDRDKIKMLDIPLTEVFGALQANLGGLYVNDLTLFGRSFQVKVQAEPQYRMQPRDIESIYVRSNGGAMVPFITFAKVESTTGADLLPHYNIYRTAEVTANAAPGRSSGEVIAAMEELAAEVLPEGYGFEWTGTALQEKQADGQQGVILGMALLFVFLVLAAQYESWAVPFAVLFGLPIGVFGAFLGSYLRRLTNDVYVQIGLVMLIGLAAKNAILIEEFAKAGRRRSGASRKRRRKR